MDKVIINGEAKQPESMLDLWLDETPAPKSDVVTVYEASNDGSPYIYTCKLKDGLYLACGGLLTKVEDDADIEQMIAAWRADSMRG